VKELRNYSGLGDMSLESKVGPVEDKTLLSENPMGSSCVEAE